MFLLSRHAVLIEEVPVGYRKVAALQLEASGMATGCPLSALRLSRRHRTGVQWGPRVPSHKGLSHGGSHHGYPTEGVTKDNGGGEERGGGDTVSVCQADRLGSRGQNVETSISGSSKHLVKSRTRHAGLKRNLQTPPDTTNADAEEDIRIVASGTTAAATVTEDDDSLHGKGGHGICRANW